MPDFRLNFDVPGAPEGQLRQVIQRIEELGSMVALREARQNALEFRDTGALSRSIQAEVRDGVARIYVPPNQPTAAYALVMEEGRRPGARMPPPDALLGWMRRHGIPEAYAFVIARNIGRRGIQGRHYMRRAFETLQQQMPAIIDRAMREVLR